MALKLIRGKYQCAGAPCDLDFACFERKTQRELKTTISYYLSSLIPNSNSIFYMHSSKFLILTLTKFPIFFF
jgi:hypothetical protein